MRIDLSSAPGDPERPNEDWLSASIPTSGGGGVLVALDGVTPPGGDVGCGHGVPWFAARLGGRLTELSGSRGDMPLDAVLAEAIRSTADAHRDTCDLSHVRTPQATVVVVRWDQEYVEHLVLSDSVLLLCSPEGEVTAVLDDRLDRLPPEVLRSVAATDALRNADAEGGFFTAAADPAVAARAVTGRTPRERVTALAALTDGASRWTDTFQEGDWTDCLAVLRKEGAEALIGRVRVLESAPARDGVRARYKRHDDASAAYAEL
ncbi:protein phosphatase 2C domain-containing protein [Streptomyces sp. G-G2]|uniref:protein phosphatase 2C domain-containing protein n=1 Tax=Streptomyces sp. G-G2 TaxID=3046201 RepID=UPI0024BA9A0F|nr:protein phosphatase 2C domain-containing protein [Streptomyces sp. G-G2]MDJ0379308.1 protein phosphatase 2C domain-containing protein [Streptomyces sp. G-G2]